MSNKAIHPITGKEVYAVPSTEKLDYKCCNNECNAVLRFRRGEHQCFFAIKSKPHMEGCPFSNNYEPPNYIIPEGFSLEEIIQNLKDKKSFHNQSKSTKVKSKSNKNIIPTTPLQLYECCKQNELFYLENCVDSSFDFNTLCSYGINGIQGYKVLCGIVKYYKVGHSIILNIQSSVSDKKFANIILKMNSDTYNIFSDKAKERWGDLQGAKVIICGCCIKQENIEFCGRFPIKTNTMVYLESISQAYFFYKN